MSLQIQETDEAGAHVATYVTSRDGQGTARVDVIQAASNVGRWQTALGVFLPAGYPQSVTGDYLE
ncbi:hypothetical protein MMC32_006630 [Xylographa parallela]|nr:hypothetical protein [Xylographa parallela]